MPTMIALLVQMCAGGLAAGTLYALYVNRRPPNVDIPPPHAVSGNGFGQLTGIVERLRDVLNRYETGQEEQFRPERLTRQQRDALLAECGPPLDEAHAVVRGPLQFPNTGELAERASWASTARNLAKSLSACAACCRLNGDPDGAAAMALDIVEAGRKFARNGVLIEGLVGIAVEDIGYAQLEPAIPQMSAGGLLEAASRTDALEPSKATWQDFVVEEGRWLARLRQSEFQRGGAWRRMRHSFGAPLELLPDVPGSVWLPQSLREGLKLLVTDKDQYIRAILDLHSRYAVDASWPSGGADADDECDVPGVWLPAAASQLAFAKRDAVSALQRTCIALYTYRHKNGRFPETLDSLVPMFLPAAPADPFGGEPGDTLLYRTQDDGFILYSRGPDRKDDGGAWVTWPQLLEGGDMVAGRIFERPPDDPRAVDG